MKKLRTKLDVIFLKNLSSKKRNNILFIIDSLGDYRKFESERRYALSFYMDSETRVVPQVRSIEMNYEVIEQSFR